MEKSFIVKKTVCGTQTTMYHACLKQNIWVSEDFEHDISFDSLTSKLNLGPSGKNGAWLEFEKRVRDLHTSGQTTRVALGPAFAAKTDRRGEKTLKYRVRRNTAIPTHFFALIVQGEHRECYLLPRGKTKQSLEETKTTRLKVQKAAGIVFGKKSLSTDQTPSPKSCTVLKKKDFVILHDGRTRQPICTIHEVSKQSLRGTAVRTNKFIQEKGLPKYFQVQDSDYSASGYDKGHFTPAEDCKSSKDMMEDSFSYANTGPQTPATNRGHIKRLENYTRYKARRLPSSADKVKVVTGTLFLPEEGKSFVDTPVIGKSEIPVATHFYKILKTEGETEAYLVPHTNEKFKGNRKKFLDTYRVSLETICELSGLDFSQII